MARNLSEDHYRALKEITLAPARKRVGLFARELGGMAGRILRGQENHDSFAWDDPQPWLNEIGRLLRGAAWSVLRRLRPTQVWMRRRARRRFSQFRASRPGQRIAILFICSGNICRSPFAEHYLAATLRRQKLDVAVESAGLLIRPPSKSPADAICAARKHGVDLTSHHSRVVDRAAIGQDTAIIVFDRLNLERLAARGLLKPEQTFLLGELCGRDPEIADPFGRGREAFDYAYDAIAHSLDQLAAELA